MWVSRERIVQGSASEKALKQSMLGVFEAQKEYLWLKKSKRGKGIGN